MIKPSLGFVKSSTQYGNSSRCTVLKRVPPNHFSTPFGANLFFGFTAHLELPTAYMPAYVLQYNILLVSASAARLRLMPEHKYRSTCAESPSEAEGHSQVLALNRSPTPSYQLGVFRCTMISTRKVDIQDLSME